MTERSGAELSGHRTIVAGGSSGIGLWAAHRLAAAGARVALLARDETRLRSAAELIERAHGVPVATRAADVSDDAAVRAAIGTLIDELGGLDILVNSAATPAGEIRVAPLADIDAGYVLSEVDIKVVGALRTIAAAAPTLVAQGRGRIINIAGQSVQRTGNLVATLRNAGVVAVSKNAAAELGPAGVTVNVIHPGDTITGIPGEPLPANDGADTVLGRRAHAGELGDLIVFLASDRAAVVNGESFFIAPPRDVFYTN